MTADPKCKHPGCGLPRGHAVPTADPSSVPGAGGDLEARLRMVVADVLAPHNALPRPHGAETLEVAGRVVATLLADPAVSATLAGSGEVEYRLREATRTWDRSTSLAAVQHARGIVLAVRPNAEVHLERAVWLPFDLDATPEGADRG